MSALYSIGAINQLANSLEQAGFEPEDITKLKQSKSFLKRIKKTLDENPEIEKELKRLDQWEAALTERIHEHEIICSNSKLKRINIVTEDFLGTNLNDESRNADVQRILGKLNPVVKDMITSRFGIGCTPCSLKNIAENHQITEQKVSRIIHNALEKLRCRSCNLSLQEY